MSDSISLPNEKKEALLRSLHPPFLTVAYNPAAHPKQITLLDTHGQPVLYKLTSLDQNNAAPNTPQLPSNNTPVIAIAQNIPPNANVCFICGSQATDKCSFGVNYGRPCDRFLCLSHTIELSSTHGVRYPHCPEHYQHIQQNKCHMM